MPYHNISLLGLPTDILVNIFKKLSISDIRNLMLSCKTLQTLIINDNILWRFLRRRLLILQNEVPKNDSFSNLWYNRCRISHNWTKGIYRDKVILRHFTNYMPWLCLQNHSLFLSVGSELRCYPTNSKGLPICRELLWKVHVPTVTRNDVRTNDISRFKMKGNNIICGNRDGCIAVYNYDNIRAKPHLVQYIYDCHEQGQVEVTAVELVVSKDKLMKIISASNNSPSLMFWKASNVIMGYENNFESDLCERELLIPECVGIRCLALNKDQSKLSIGLNGNNVPMLIDVETGAILLTNEIKNKKQAVRDIQWHDENTIIYVTHSGYLQCVDIRSSELTYNAVDPFQSTLYCIKSDNQQAIIVGSSEYSRCVLFDSRTSARHIQMYFTQKKSSPIYSLDFDSTKLVAAADRSVAVLDFNISVSTTKERDYSHTFEFVT